MDYADALAWLYARQRIGIKLGLDKVRQLLAAVGDPQQAMRIVHVAGTNGKGSVCTLVASALQNSGHRVGRFSSPHLVRFTERIVVDGVEILPDEATHIMAQLREPVNALDEAGTPPSFFEIVTAMALLHFRNAKVAWAVLETGMGGRLDATNVVGSDLTIITNVALDHQEFLGDNIREIAAEKAGIMKPGIPCVTGAEAPALAILKQVSHEREVPMAILGEDYHLLPGVNGLRLVHPQGEAHYDVAMAGEHQLQNAALAVMACDALRSRGVTVPTEAVQRALAHTKVPGRLESIHVDGVEYLLDAAHNEAGAVALRRHFAHRDLGGFQLVVGFSKDKQWPAMLDQWVPLAAHVHAVPLRTDRGLDPEEMRGHVEGIGIPFSVHANASDALEAAGGAGLTVVAGSLFLVGEARAVLTGQPLEDIRGNQ